MNEDDLQDDIRPGDDEEEPEPEDDQQQEPYYDPEEPDGSDEEHPGDNEEGTSDDGDSNSSEHRVNIEYDEPDMVPRRSRRSTNPIQDLINRSRRQSEAFATEIQGTTRPNVRTSTVTPKVNRTSSRTQINSTIIINQNRLKVRSAPITSRNHTTIKLWKKEDRAQLPADIRQVFVKAATGYVLSKNNKLNYVDITPDAEGALKNVHNLQSQLTILHNHMISYDIAETCIIVVPTDVERSPNLNNVTFDLFVDYPRLQDHMVANSCAYYNMWAADAFIGENMSLVLKLLQNNTDDHLWTKCLEKYEEFHPVQQGGALMLYLILRKIQDVSETAIQHLRTQLENMDISKVPGENVDIAVSLVKATNKTLLSASTSSHSFIPDDFPNTILKVFQTTSVSDFNAAFAEEERLAQREADKSGGLPAWPEIEEITSLATNTYSRLKNTGHWVKPAKPAAMISTPKKTPKTPTTPKAMLQFNPADKGTKTIYKKFDPECFNCGGKHLVQDCPKPKNEDTIKANRKKFFDKIRAKREARTNPQASVAVATPATTTSEVRQPKIVRFGVDKIRQALADTTKAGH